MAKFMCTATYTAEGARGLAKDGGTKRKEVVSKLLSTIGGSLEGFYFTLGAEDAVLIVDVPDTVTAVALSLTVNSTGAVRVSLTQLLTPADLDAAARKTIPYTPPGA